MGMSKQMMKKQKKWSKPQLIILGRGKTEENVLAGCKRSGIHGPGSNWTDQCFHGYSSNPCDSTLSS